MSKVDIEFVYILDLCYVNYYKDDLLNALFKGKLFNRKTVAIQNICVIIYIMELTQDTDCTMESYIKFRNLFSHNMDVNELLFKEI